MKTDSFYFEKTIELAREALERGDDGFASILVGPDGEILLGRGNEAGASSHNPLNHDTIVLVNEAVKLYDADFLSKCTVYAIMEPCVMCMGACFWAGISHVKYAMSEEELNDILPGGLQIHSEMFCKLCPRPMDSIGPFPEMTGAYDVVKAWVQRILGN